MTALKQELKTIDTEVESPRLPAPIDALIERAVMTPDFNVEKLERLFEFKQRIEATEARKAFDEAMSAARAEIPIIRKNREVDFTSTKGRTHYRHEDLAEVARTVNPILSKHGLSYRFRTSSPPNEPVTVTCIVSHRLGYSEENTLSAGRDDSGNKNSIQAVGSTLTYLQRMTLKAALGLAASDDDDGAGSERDAEPISAKQVEELRRLIVDVNADLPKLLGFLKVERLEDIYASRFADVKRIIEQKRKAQS